MAKLKSGYKMVYEKDPITTTADHRDIRATKTIPAITDGQVELRDYETGTVIARNTFYKMYERIVDNAIRLYGVKRSDESVVEFTVHSSAGDLLMGTLKPEPPAPSANIYFHTIVLDGSSEEITGNLTVTLYSTTNETLTPGPVNKQEIIDKVLSNIVNYDSLDYEGKSSDNPNIPVGFNIVGDAVGFACALLFNEFADRYSITNIISDTVGEVTNAQATASNEDLGYIHELDITDTYNVEEWGFVPDTLKLFVRLDTAEAVPAFGENTGTKEDTMAFLMEHLINVLYYKFDITDTETGTTETRYDTVSIIQDENAGAGDISMYPSESMAFGAEYYIEGLTDLTE